MKKVFSAFTSQKKIHFDLIFVFGLFCLYWILFAQKIFNNSHLSHDNFTYHFYAFYYFASSLLAGFGFPTILFDFGGSEIAITTISLGYFTPHRIISYFLYCNSHLSPILVYKISILAGLFFNCLGWFWFWKKIFPRSLAKFLCATLYLFSGIGLTVWHQEQILFTLTYAPWFLISLIYITKNNLNSADAFGILVCFIGLMLLTHYPQIHILMITVFFLSLIFTSNKKNIPLPSLKVVNLQNIFLLIISFCPLAYIYFCAEAYGSPLRETGNLSTQELQKYIDLNKLQHSSAPLIYFVNVLFARKNACDDEFLLVLGVIACFLVILGLQPVFRKRGKWLSIFILLAFSCWAFLGINGGLAQILFLLKMPQISSFRQWYHFGPFIVILLITLAGFGFQNIETRLSKYKVWLLLICFAGIVSQFIFMSKKYLSVVATTKESIEKRLSSNEFLQKIINLDFKIPPNLSSVKPLVSLKSSLEFYKNKSLSYHNLIKIPKTNASTELLITPKKIKIYSNEDDYTELYINKELIINNDPKVQDLPSPTVVISAKKNNLKEYTFVGQRFYYLILFQKICFLLVVFNFVYKIKERTS